MQADGGRGLLDPALFLDAQAAAEIKSNYYPLCLGHYRLWTEDCDSSPDRIQAGLLQPAPRWFALEGILESPIGARCSSQVVAQRENINLLFSFCYSLVLMLYRLPGMIFKWVFVVVDLFNVVWDDFIILLFLNSLTDKTL